MKSSLVQSTANCPYCKKSSQLYFRAKDRNRKISNEEFNYYRCKECSYIFLSPIPEDLDKYYPKSYYILPESLEQLAAQCGGEAYKIDIIRQFISQGRLLEIGPATGGFVYHAKKAGFEVEAIEMDERCCQFLRKFIKIPVIQSDDSVSALKKTLPYNVIALWHVIEHLSDLWDIIDAIADKLLPGGIVLLAAPNPDALQFHLFKQFWTHLDAPRHVALIPRRTLIEYMEKKGFKTLISTTQDEGSIGWNKFGWVFSLCNFSNWKCFKKALFLMGRCINKSMKFFENRNGLGSAYTLVFQKKDVL